MPLRVALLGFGTVGQDVARILAAQPELRLTHVFNRDVARKRADWVPADVQWTEDMLDILGSPADVIVEVVGGVEPAGTWIRQALEAGKHVVTANKQLLAQRGGELTALAAEHGVYLEFEASVAGGIPVIRAIREGLAGDRLVRVSGILNGTCNYVLTRMEADGVPFGAALADAQARGFAEADPTDDVDGYDARAKLCILARVGFHRDVRPELVSARSIRAVDGIDFQYAGRLGCTIRQVSRAETDADSDCLIVWVQPALVSRLSPLARVVANQNLVLVAGEHGGETAYSGLGAGGGPTAVAVVSDLVAIASRGGARGAPPVTSAIRPAEVTDRFLSAHYLRFVVRDRPGILASLATVLSEHGINIDAVFQEPNRSKEALPFVITLEECDPHILRAALGRISQFDFHVTAPLAMPILTDGTGGAGAAGE
jgi:homoserine dehydrogenase